MSPAGDRDLYPGGEFVGEVVRGRRRQRADHSDRNPVRDGQEIRKGRRRRVGEPVDAAGQLDHIAGIPHSVERAIGQPGLKRGLGRERQRYDSASMPENLTAERYM